MTYKHLFPHPANDLHKYTPDHLFSVLSRNYWETQGAIWDPVRRELTHTPVYFRICLFRVECSGCTSWQSREKGGRREGEREGTRDLLGASCNVAPEAPFTASSTGTASVCPHIVRLTRGEKKLTKSQIK